MNILNILSMNIKKYRLEKDISQEELAFKSDLHRTYISDIERKKRNISLLNLEKIANALEIEPYKLLLENKEDI